MVVLRADMKDKLKLTPDKPGVYLMKDREGAILYIGKARSLRNRLSTYFVKSSSHPPKVTAMLQGLATFEYIVTDLELEALLLENLLIKKHQPKYNVILKDDKNYPYLKLTLSEEFPRLAVVRRIGSAKDLYFGPYVPTGALRRVLRVIYDIFPLRQCVRMYQNRTRPCINYQMGRCLAPCFGKVAQEEYQKQVQGVRLFLEGKSKKLEDLLQRQMEKAAGALQFEQAARFRDQLLAVKMVQEKQKIISPGRTDGDVVGLFKAGGLAALTVFFLREGVFTGHKTLFLEEIDRRTQDEELLSSFLFQFYANQARLPKQIILPLEFMCLPKDEKETLEEWLSDRRGAPLKLIIPQRGEKLKLLALAAENARLALEGLLSQQGKGNVISNQLMAELGLSKPPERIEAFDISNILGRLAVGSLVVWQKGGFRKSDYRHYNIKTVNQADDYAMIKETLSRCYSRRLAEGKALPDLILIDGGRGQLSVGLRVLDKLGLQEIPVLGLAKRLEEIYLPRQAEPLRLPSSSASLKLLQRVRDEAHRFAITAHRRFRGKTALASVLREIPQIGPQRRAALLRHFGSLKRIMDASLEELTSLSFLGQKVARQVHGFFHPTDTDSKIRGV